MASGTGFCGRCGIGAQGMVVGRQIARGQNHVFSARFLPNLIVAKSWALADAEWNATTQVRKGKCGYSITSICVTNDRKNAVFWLIGNNRPSQKAQPAGSKLPAKIMISPKKGSAMVFTSTA